MNDRIKQTEIACLIRGHDPHATMIALDLVNAMKEENGGPLRDKPWGLQDVAGVMDLANSMAKLEHELSK